MQSKSKGVSNSMWPKCTSGSKYWTQKTSSIINSCSHWIKYNWRVRSKCTSTTPTAHWYISYSTCMMIVVQSHPWTLKKVKNESIMVSPRPNGNYIWKNWGRGGFRGSCKYPNPRGESVQYCLLTDPQNWWNGKTLSSGNTFMLA